MHNKLSFLSGMMLLMILCTIAGCGRKNEIIPETGKYYYYPSSETKETESEISEESVDDLYLVILNNSVEEVIQLYKYDNGLIYQFHYALSTNFKDKYGNHSSASSFTSGKVVWVGDTDSEGKLKEIGLSDRVWEYTGISRFETNPEEGILKIADSNYAYGEESITFYEDSEVAFDSITEDDELSVVGIGKKVLSVCVTTGHGTLELDNTELFEGSYLQLDTRYFVEITPDLTMDLPEGTYKLSVANNGWGGTTDIEIKQGETTKVDLDVIKGDGPSYGLITFKISEEDAKLYIDGEEKDYSEPISVQYGRHALKIVTEKYGDWERTLYVNSEEAVIEITLNSEETTEPSSENNSEAGSESEKSSESETSSSMTKEELEEYLKEYLTDYLSTLSSMLTGLL